MLKIIGIVFIMFASGIYGFKKAYIPYKRYKNLEKIRSAFLMIENEIAYSGNFIDDIFLNVANIMKFDGIFKTVTDHSHDIKISKRWELAVEKDYKILFLKKEDKNFLTEFSQGLGKMNRPGQLMSIKKMINLLDIQIKKAYEEYISQSKLFKGMGLCIGLFIVIIFI